MSKNDGLHKIEEIFKELGLGSEEDREKYLRFFQEEDEEINVNRLGLFTYS